MTLLHDEAAPQEAGADGAADADAWDNIEDHHHHHDPKQQQQQQAPNEHALRIAWSAGGQTEIAVADGGDSLLPYYPSAADEEEEHLNRLTVDDDDGVLPMHVSAGLSPTTNKTTPTSSSSNNISNNDDPPFPQAPSFQRGGDRSGTTQPPPLMRRCWQAPLQQFLTDRVAVPAARRPVWTLCAIVAMALACVLAGLGTNFRIENREQHLWSPRGSRPERHHAWIQQNQFVSQKEDFLPNNETATSNGNSNRDDIVDAPFVVVIVHADGRNVVTRDGMARNLEAIGRAQSAAGYREHCAAHGDPPCPTADLALVCYFYGVPIGPDATNVCPVASVSAFWFHNATVYEANVANDLQLQQTLSLDVFPGEEGVFDISDFVGYGVYENVTVPSANNETISTTTQELLVSAKSYLSVLSLPGLDYERDNDDPALERRVRDQLLRLQSEWESDAGNVYRVELYSERSFEDEFTRGVYKDLPLMPFVGILMSAFTALVFYKRGDWLHSQTLLGVGAVGCVFMSICTGYGILFLAGLPFTNLTLALLFIVFGIGLDDAFIIYSAYVRTDPALDVIERIRETYSEVAVSIAMTTATTETAFFLGCFSPVPAIRWLCIYAFVTIGIDFGYQITFFTALIVLDEKRIQARRKDCLFCYKVNEDDNVDNVQAETMSSENSAEQKNATDGANAEDQHLHRSGRIMNWWAGLILRPWVKALILVIFTAFLGACIWSTTLLRLNFDFRAILPSDSYIIRFYDAATLYTNRQGPAPFVYFRYVDQSDPDIQTQMLSYVDELVGIDAITEPPFRFWLVDYLEYVGNSNSADLQDLPFIDSLYLFLQDSEHDFWEDLLFDATGQQLVASRTQVNMDNVNVNMLSTGLKALEEQREVTRAQPVNQGTDDWAFFTFDELFLLWEFLFITPDELTKSTLIGLGSVSLMSVLFMPHWTGILFVAPMVVILYVDLMGFVQFFGIDINGVTYVSLLVAIGLLVDYVMHVVLRYYETPETASRDAKVKDVLRTMGASVMLGGISTFLGIVPLMFSASDIIFTFVITFTGVVIIGLSHGLIVLPVLLSLVGPKGQHNFTPTVRVIVTKVKSGQTLIEM